MTSLNVNKRCIIFRRMKNNLFNNPFEWLLYCTVLYYRRSTESEKTSIVLL